LSIRHGVSRAAGLVGAVGLLAGPGVTAPAAQAATRPASATPQPAGNLYQGMAGVPKSVKRGQSIVFPLWFMERSPDTMQVMAAGLRVDGGSLTGVVVDWLDPVTKRWEPSTGSWGSPDSHYLQLPVAPRLVYPSGYWGHIFVRVTFTSKARPGQWYLAPDVPYEYQLWTRSGAPSSGYLNEPVSTVGATVSVHT
jgi:hypothetical protein